MLSGVLPESALVFAFVGLVVGLIFGSAINAMVWRLYVGRSWTKGRSECPDCGHVLAAKDLVPVVSWVLLAGKCRYCRKPIKDHPVVEVVTAAVFGVSAFVLAPMTSVEWVGFGFWLLMAVLLIVLAVYDARWLLLPDKVMWPLVSVAAVYSIVMAIMTRDVQVALGSLEAALLAGGSFLLIVVATKGRAMGGGDIKLAFAMGLILGLQATLVAMLVAFNVAAVVGIVLMIRRKKGRKDLLPFGPYLVGGTIVAFLFGRAIVEWYLHLNGL